MSEIDAEELEFQMSMIRETLGDDLDEEELREMALEYMRLNVPEEQGSPEANGVAPSDHNSPNS